MGKKSQGRHGNLFLAGDAGCNCELDRHCLNGAVGSGDGEGYAEFSGWREAWRPGTAAAAAATTASADNYGAAGQQATPYKDGEQSCFLQALVEAEDAEE